MKLVILGGPGAGKGTQSIRLSHSLNIPRISVGEILRQSIANQTKLGVLAQGYVEKGELIPDELMIKFMRLRLQDSDVENGWIMEGYPRNAFQAEELDFLLEELKQKLDKAIYLHVSDEVLKERSLKRGLVDDIPEIIERRIQIFKERTLSMLDYYDYRNMLVNISAQEDEEKVTAEILAKIA